MHSLSDFHIDRQTCEARIPQNFLFWDYSGRLWTALGRTFPTLKAVNVNPNHTEFEAGDFLLVAEPGVLRITAKGTVSFDDYLDKACVFFKACLEILRVEVFDRVGYRAIWIQEFASMAKASESFNNFGVLTLPNEPLFGIDAPPIGLETRITWESEDIGVMVGLRAEKRAIEPQIPWEVRSQIQAAGSERFVLVVDSDRYTRKTLSRDRLDVQEWIGSSNRTLRKSLSKGFFK